MLTLPARHYIVAALDNTPATLSALLSHFPTNSDVWATRPFPDRLSLREVVAHLADWDTVWLGRFERTLNEDYPVILRPDPDQRAVEQGYATVDPVASLALFQERRAALTAWLRALPDDAWVRVCHLDRIGDVPIEGLISLALSHDAYHTRQVAEWLALGPPF